MEIPRHLVEQGAAALREHFPAAEFQTLRLPEQIATVVLEAVLPTGRIKETEHEG
jgi:hypothetical protein